MSKGIMLVTSRPASALEADAYHRWYDEVHVPEMLAVEGFASARRFEGADGAFVAIYEVDDVDAAQAALAAARESGARTLSLIHI